MTLRNITILLCLVVTVVIVAVLSMPDDAPTVVAGLMKAPAQPDAVAHIPNASTAESKLPAKPVDWKRFAAMTEKGGTGMPTFSAEDLARFIGKHGETPANLIVAFDQSGDRKWLERALVAHPDSPIVLVAALTESPDATAEQRAVWLEKLKAVEASNPVPWILSAHALFKAGHSAEATLEAAAALERPAFYTYAPERIAAARAFYESVGMHPLEAELMATVALKMSLLAPVMAVSKGLEAAKTAEGAEASVKAAQIQYGLGRLFQTPEASRTLISQLVGIAQESKGIAVLPAEEQARRKTEIDAFKKGMSGLTESVAQLMASQNEERLAQYVRRLRTDGELSAMRWLKEQQK